MHMDTVYHLELDRVGKIAYCCYITSFQQKNIQLLLCYEFFQRLHCSPWGGNQQGAFTRKIPVKKHYLQHLPQLRVLSRSHDYKPARGPRSPSGPCIKSRVWRGCDTDEMCQWNWPWARTASLDSPDEASCVRSVRSSPRSQIRIPTLLTVPSCRCSWFMPLWRFTDQVKLIYSRLKLIYSRLFHLWKQTTMPGRCVLFPDCFCYVYHIKQLQ